MMTNTCRAAGNEIYVNRAYFGDSDGSADNPYNTIQSAIDVANNGDTIYIFGGLYQENLVIDKQIKIIGSIDEVETVIDGRFDTRYLIEVTADEVTIEYVTVTDDDKSTSSPIGALIALKSEDNRIINNRIVNTSSYGIYLDSTSANNLISSNYINKTKSGIYGSSSLTNDIINNEISNCTEYGIYIEYSSGNNRIYGNYIKYSDSGIYIKNSNNLNITNNTIYFIDSYSLYLNQCTSSIVTLNNFSDSTSHSIYLKSSACSIFGNKFKNNTRGMTIQGSNNYIYNNTFNRNTASGIYIISGSNSNRIYINKFKYNGKSAQDYGNNQWYYNNRGNYWSDYNYIDLDLDGFGDEKYSKNGVLDLYPLGYFLKPPKKPSDPSPEDFETGVGLSITLQVHVEDPDSDELTVYFYRADDDSLIRGISQNPVKRVQNDSTAECKFTLGFNTTFAWYAVADDGILQNQSKPFIFSTPKTPPDNEPPIANAGGPYYAEVGDLVQFNSSASYDPDGEISFYRWNFGDASSEILEENPTHIYNSPMEYSVILTIIDNNGSSASSTTFIAVGSDLNDPPVARFSLTKGPSGDIVTQAKTGQSIYFDSSETYDIDNTNLNFNWNFGNGVTSIEENPTYSYPSPGTYVISLTVSDGELTDTKSTTIEIKAKKSSGTPGFELILLISAISVICFINKKKKI